MKPSSAASTFIGVARGRSRGPGPGFLGPAFGPFEVEGDPARGTLQAHGVSLPQGFTSRELEARDALRGRFDRGLPALDYSEELAGLDRFHRQAVEVLYSDRVRAALDLTRAPNPPSVVSRMVAVHLTETVHGLPNAELVGPTSRGRSDRYALEVNQDQARRIVMSLCGTMHELGARSLRCCVTFPESRPGVDRSLRQSST